MPVHVKHRSCEKLKLVYDDNVLIYSLYYISYLLNQLDMHITYTDTDIYFYLYYDYLLAISICLDVFVVFGWTNQISTARSSSK